MLEAIWPSFAHWHLDSLPKSADISAPDLLCFSLFWIASFPFLFVSMSSLRWVFVVKIAIMPLFYVALFTWALTAGNGVGPLFSIPNKITSGQSIGYVFCSTILATIGGNASKSYIEPERHLLSHCSLCCQHGRHYSLRQKPAQLSDRPGFCASDMHHNE
jgi:cytosine/uracil/thiamine/allantoin permease